MGQIEFRGVRITRLNHAAFKLENGGKVIYIDPFQLTSSPKDGNIIICTHDHYDHCSIEDIQKVIKPNGVIIASINCESKLKILRNEIKLLNPHDQLTVNHVIVTAVPAYNIKKRYHPRDYKGIGVVIEIAGVRVYHAGDTDLIPEMDYLSGKVDVALVPISGVYVMDVEEAIEAIKRVRPALAIPMHYGAIVGGSQDAERFRQGLRGICDVVII
ncbi:MAG: MBL fold metallo-hydrolase [Thermofilaceae archaeon]